MSNRLFIHVEGDTELDFVQEVLRPHLIEHGYFAVEARKLGRQRNASRRGGIRPWPESLDVIARHLKQDPACAATTMVDYYGLPDDGPGAWPGRASSELEKLAEGKAVHVESAVAAAVRDCLGSSFNPARFIPFVLMHEFEALLFSNCAQFAEGICQKELASGLQSIRDQFASPEEINDSKETAPSKRILKLFPRYQKPLLGVLAAHQIGLPAIRAACPHFNSWINALESLAAHP